MSDAIRGFIQAAVAGALLLLGMAAIFASSNGRWVAAGGGAVLDTRTGRICALDKDGRGYCDDYAGFRVIR